MARQCPYLTEKVANYLEHKYCEVCRKFTYDIYPDPYDKYCNNWSSGYEECPHYKKQEEGR